MMVFGIVSIGNLGTTITADGKETNIHLSKQVRQKLEFSSLNSSVPVSPPFAVLGVSAGVFSIFRGFEHRFSHFLIPPYTTVQAQCKSGTQNNMESGRRNWNRDHLDILILVSTYY
eukprot:scaffold16490_cov113-Cylindrotheca_fusiformis.AAC.3